MGRCLTTSVSLALLLFLALPEAVSAHAFLVRSSPRVGDRLAEGPSTLSLDFSYPTVAGSAVVSVRTAAGAPVAAGPPQPSPEGTALRVDLPLALRGVYLVSWQVLATDGATTMGEFAFGVGGAGPGTGPALPGGSTPTLITLYLPGSYIWARLWVDPAYRIQREEIVTPGHLIERMAFAYGQAAAAHHSQSGPTGEAANARHPR